MFPAVGWSKACPTITIRPRVFRSVGDPGPRSSCVNEDMRRRSLPPRRVAGLSTLAEPDPGTHLDERAGGIGPVPRVLSATAGLGSPNRPSRRVREIALGAGLQSRAPRAGVDKGPKARRMAFEIVPPRECDGVDLGKKRKDLYHRGTKDRIAVFQLGCREAAGGWRRATRSLPFIICAGVFIDFVRHGFSSGCAA